MRTSPSPKLVVFPIAPDEVPLDPEHFMIAVYCTIDDALDHLLVGGQLRRRGLALSWRTVRG